MKISSSLKSVVVWQPYFRGGGAEAVALWILEALQEDFDVTLHTLLPIDLSYLNDMYGTQIRSKNIKVVYCFPSWSNQLIQSLMNWNSRFRTFFLYFTIKKLKQRAKQYDLMFSAFNALDMGCPGIQYVHWVHVIENRPKKSNIVLKSLMKWVDFSYENLESNITLSNSQCTAGYVKKCYGIDSQVVFPPVVTNIIAKPWSEKEAAFLCSGRLVKAKQPHKIIEILRVVRDKGFNIKLYITGGGGGDYESDYLEKTLALAQKNSDWVHIYQDLAYDDYLKVVARCRYGIHYKSEPFGISVAEMVKAGMIPFVKSSGGQTEIVGCENEELLFKDEREAIANITKVLENPDLQANLLASLEERRHLFSTEQFVNDIQSVVKQYFHQSAHTDSTLKF